jgi:hypothetical protein
MSWFQLDPESVAARARSTGAPVEVPSLGTSLWRGMVGFTLVSVAGFAPWAVFGRWFYRNIGEAGLYAVCAVVFIGLSGLLLHRLILGPGSLSRFYKLFGLTFAVYSVGWIAGWMLLRGHPGSLAGLLLGTAAMGLMLTKAFDARGQTFKVITALFVLNTIGYFVGGWMEQTVAGAKQLSILGFTPSKKQQVMAAHLLWGVWYGIGFGAGLGLAFYLCQERVKRLLGAQPEASTN